MFNYIMLPNNLFYGKDKNISILEQVNYNYKVICVINYLYLYTTRIDNVNFTLEHMITVSGYKISNKKGESIEQFKNILSQLQKLKLINCDIDMNVIKPKQLVTCNLDIKYEHGFMQLYDSEINAISTYNQKKIDNMQLLFYFCYLKSRIYKRSKDEYVAKDGGNPETSYLSYNTISHDLNITDETIKKYNDILVELDLIRIGNAGLWYYSTDPNRTVKESCNIYTLYTEQEEVWKTNLKEGIKNYKKLDMNKGKVFTGSHSYKNNNRRINGKLGSIVKKEKNGTATKEDLELKEHILKLNQDNNIEFTLTALFEEINKDCGDLTLSDYYEDYNEKLYDKYFKIECDLGMYDDEFELLVDYEYYKWVMINYQKEKHDYYKNCINKHVREMKDNKTKGKGLLAKTKKETEKEVKTEEPKHRKAFGGFFEQISTNRKVEEIF